MSTLAGDLRLDTPACMSAGAKLGMPAHLPTLDGWRGIAILWVMLFHDHQGLFGPGGLLPWEPLFRFAKRGGVGVDVFFGISGFLIASRLLAERKAFGRIDLRGFYIRRAWRILPPYLAFLAVVGVLAVLGIVAINAREYLSCLAFLRNYYPTIGASGWYTSHFWSLAIEEHFYLIVPWLLALATTGRARLVALVLGLLPPIWQAMDSRYGIVANAAGCQLASNAYRTDTRIGGLFLGCWTALLFQNDVLRERLRQRLATPGWILCLALFLGVIYGPVRVPVAPLWLGLLIPLLLVGTVLHPGGVVGRVLESAPLRQVGRISYSLYLWQQLFFVSAGEPERIGWLQRFPTNWAATFACAWISYTLLERPCTALGRRLSGRKVSTSTVRSPAAVPPVLVNA